MGGLMSALGGSSFKGGDGEAGGGNKQRSGLHITTGGSDTSSTGDSPMVMLAAIAAAGFVLYSVVTK